MATGCGPVFTQLLTAFRRCIQRETTDA